jgi:probable rRNA maturation factor
MPLSCEVIVDDGVAFERADWLADLLEYAGLAEPALGGTAWHMTLRVCDDATIAALHAQFFNDPTPTDVITFPSGDESSDLAYLGDVIVSAETAADQADDGTHSAAREVAFLALHGLLHLCGFDDATDAERRAMHQRQYQHLDDWERVRGRSW